MAQFSQIFNSKTESEFSTLLIIFQGGLLQRSLWSKFLHIRLSRPENIVQRVPVKAAGANYIKRGGKLGYIGLFAHKFFIARIQQPGKAHAYGIFRSKIFFEEHRGGVKRSAPCVFVQFTRARNVHVQALSGQFERFYRALQAHIEYDGTLYRLKLQSAKFEQLKSDVMGKPSGVFKSALRPARAAALARPHAYIAHSVVKYAVGDALLRVSRMRYVRRA